MIFRPHAYQQHCINKILEIAKLGLFLDMGLGKTVTTLTAVRILKYDRFQVRKVLVIAPKKVAEGTWTREKDKWEHTKLLRVSPVLGSQAKRIRALNTPADIYIINRENVCWLVDYYRNSWPFDMVVALKAIVPNGSKHWQVSGRTSPGWWNLPEPRLLMAWMISGRRCSFWMEVSVLEKDIPSSGSGILIRDAEEQTAGYTTIMRNQEARIASCRGFRISASA